MSSEVEIQGSCDARFARVREVFAESFRTRDEVGAAVAVAVDGQLVVDLWGGHHERERTRAWRPDTLVNVYSTTKGVTALAAHRLVDEGKLDLDAPVAKYWPEFAQAGKSALPVRWLLSHRAGLPAVRKLLPNEALYDWEAMTSALAAETPWWTPGTAHGYHAVTFGWLVGEVVRRITGRSLGTYFRDEIARPLGLDLHIGLPDAEHHRVAELSDIPTDQIDPEAIGLAQVILSDPESMAARAFVNPPSMAFGPNNPEWRRAELPGVNGHCAARDLARVYGALARGGEVDGVHVLAPESIARCAAEQSFGPDLVLQVSTRFGLGFLLPQDRPDAHFGRGRRAFGHTGAGGSFGFADPDHGVGFGYVMNRMGPHILLDPRAIALIEAVYRCMGN
jgi:CubicO group peptidase (beta-lactamase class C family)